ncbi:probable WRKY transcription factor 69 [Hibiscus syriacus]|uniref:probable WRKY transcription factor 69 n=1 Tax=Hibiscus syriacus TaxID=106335 RepID=UPI0019241FF7|nr:probable WRKY transcription factor 69 [Hibiscus syriacus]
MDGSVTSVSPKLGSKEESALKPTETQASKRRKVVVERTVVTVKVGENGGKVKNEGPPSDSWCWRKYGQKPIKGYPYPRGYYKCSTSKGCSAKKQVERCKTDASMLIITYTSTHNHPGPDLNPKNRTRSPKEPENNDDDNDDRTQVSREEVKDGCEEEHFQYLQSSPLRINQEDPFIGNLERAFLVDEEPLSSSCPRIKASSSSSSSSTPDENDFFDELEELPICSAFTSFMRSKFFDEGIPVVPS